MRCALASRVTRRASGAFARSNILPSKRKSRDARRGTVRAVAPPRRAHPLRGWMPSLMVFVAGLSVGAMMRAWRMVGVSFQRTESGASVLAVSLGPLPEEPDFQFPTPRASGSGAAVDISGSPRPSATVITDSTAAVGSWIAELQAPAAFPMPPSAQPNRRLSAFAGVTPADCRRPLSEGPHDHGGPHCLARAVKLK